MSNSSERVSLGWKVEGRRCKTDIMIARSDAVSFWVEIPARFATVERGMAKKFLEEQYLQLGAASVEAICSGKRLRSSVPWAIYVPRAFLKLWLPQQNGIGGLWHRCAASSQQLQ
jgi:hypothetical protein